jgi:hypothetical protein
VRVFSQDERRFGLRTVRRRRLTAGGVPPVGAVQHVCDWCSVYGAVEPTTGARLFLALPYLKADAFQLFSDAFAHACPDSRNLLRLDNSGAPTAPRLQGPDNVRYVRLPPYGPALTPSERLWRDLKDALAWRHFPNLDAPQLEVGDLLQAYDASALHALTGDPYLGEAMNALAS